MIEISILSYVGYLSLSIAIQRTEGEGRDYLPPAQKISIFVLLSFYKNNLMQSEGVIR